MNDPAELASYWATIFAALIFIVAIIILGQNK
nr:MAG TPA: Phospholamban [Caudoviricetes sp.]